MKKLLWVGDAACDTGFAKATHGVLETLRHYYSVVVLGTNYRGDPHKLPYPIYAAGASGDLFGSNRIKKIAEREKVDLVVIQNDIWNLPPYLQQLEGKLPVVGVLAVDGRNSKGSIINNIELAIFWTEFGLEEARLGGFVRPAHVIPLGVNTDVYRPLDKKQCRRNVLPRKFINGTPSKDSFIIGNVNRNQPRKRLDLSLSIFAEWIKKYDAPDAYLLLHVAPTGKPTYDLRQLAAYYKISDRIILSGYNKAFREDEMAQLYSCFDLGLTTTQGEGWGLTTMEAMACGVPQIAPEWSALAEWGRDTIELIPCSDIATTGNRINAIGGLPDRAKMIMSLQALYVSKQKRAELALKSRELTLQEKYSWPYIGEQFVAALKDVA